ncbi:hypothetical protein B7494_g3120 [Chlorociboria aeruginascens]|nr:hypothetical protein B7494_g3120 [Chlorociboria aeruginascens]
MIPPTNDLPTPDSTNAIREICHDSIPIDSGRDFVPDLNLPIARPDCVALTWRVLRSRATLARIILELQLHAKLSALPDASGALTKQNNPQSNDLYEFNDPVTRPQAQRQQSPRTHIEAASAGISPRVRFAKSQHTHGLDLSSSQFSSQYSLEDKRPHRSIRISRNTASAILYTLEEALRHPNPFTPDLLEENASMADLIGSNGAGRNDGSTGSPTVKGPRDIMRARAEREAKRKAEREREALERARVEEEQKMAEERQKSERRAAGAAGKEAGQRVSDNSQRSERRSGERTSGEAPLQGRGTGGRAVGGGDAIPAGRPRGPTQPQRPVRNEPGPSNVPAPEQTRSSFPHAFERWETLSAHWEGLTSFWIRRLEENSNEINNNPLSQQLSRQVTDLSAAGANLFHAVVELQRLRASSERKFQRWFFETRAEQERAQEIQAEVTKTLEDERRGRATAIAEAVALERNKSTNEKQLAEMRRELQISKEEARRAWEELGRREQVERERTNSLRDGLPTIVGGVQVVPMMQGVTSRHGSSRDIPPTREGPITPPTQPQESHRPSPPATEAPAVQPTFYQQNQGTTLHPVERPASEGAFSEEEYQIDAQGQFVRDARGNKVLYQAPSDDDTDEFDVSDDRERELAYRDRYGHPDRPTPTSVPQEYTGEGYGGEWETRHHHPTRLSDVLEEDEHSRTSASQMSRRDTLPKKHKTVEELKSRYRSGPFSWKAGLLFLSAGAGLITYFRYEKARMERKRIAEATKGVGKPKVGGPFELIDHNGKPFSDLDMRGKYSLVYFGFTHCPDICPEELDKMAQTIDIVASASTASTSPPLLPIFITCDPARDTPAVLATYLAEFHPSLIGLTGTWEEIKQVCKKYRVYFSTPEGVQKGQDYLVDHSIYFYLMDPEGDFVEAIGRQHSPQQAAKIILDHVGDWKR